MRAFAGWHFDEDVQRTIHWLKYQKHHSLAGWMGRHLAQRAAAGVAELETALFIPVPLHKKRRRERGFNQSELLIDGIRSLLPESSTANVLLRVINTRSQAQLGRVERFENVEKAFAVGGKFASRLGSRAVVLVDDVCTTGATLAACALALKAEGARNIAALTFATASWSSHPEGGRRPGEAAP